MVIKHIIIVRSSSLLISEVFNNSNTLFVSMEVIKQLCYLWGIMQIIQIKSKHGPVSIRKWKLNGIRPLHA